MQSVKIISGFSSMGGSTLYFIKLTNLLNREGYDCTFYGPHDWHLDKCKSGYIGDPPRPRTPVDIYPTDIVISHFIDLNLGPIKAKKHILSCHETNLFKLKDKDLNKYDVIQYVSDSQRKWHNVKYPYVIIPPTVDHIKWTSPKNNIAGVIGSIDSHKQTHLSVKAALKDGYDKVLLYGNIGEKKYFEGVMKPLLNDPRIVMMGTRDNKEVMYGSVEAVYHDSKRETYGLVEAECKVAGVPFIGVENNPDILKDKEILERWKSVLSE